MPPDAEAINVNASNVSMAACSRRFACLDHAVSSAARSDGSIRPSTLGPTYTDATKLRTLGFVSFNDGMDSSNDSVGIDVPESLLYRQGGAHPCRTIRALP